MIASNGMIDTFDCECRVMKSMQNQLSGTVLQGHLKVI